MRGVFDRAVPSSGAPAVQAFRACKGCGWQNGKWLLMARINLFGPDWKARMSAGNVNISAIPARIRLFQLCFGASRIGQVRPASFI